jgi:predicted lactoylglutathione lyase
MTTTNTRKMFVNLPVSNLERSKEFFSRLGFEFNPQFSNDEAACMVISEQAIVMLLVKPFFTTFTSKRMCDAAKETEVINALSCSSRAEVDQLADKALALGGKAAQSPQDHGFMYSRSFYDVDDHQWEVLWMDPAQIQ